jgi:hypothetical protein
MQNTEKHFPKNDLKTPMRLRILSETVKEKENKETSHNTTKKI